MSNNIFDKNNRLIISAPYIIAEAGVNHEGSLKKAYKLIDFAKKGGADAIKFQTYKAEKLVIKNSPAYWDTKKEKTKNQFDLFKKYDHFEKEDYIKLYRHCVKKKIDFLSTPFDNESVDFLNPLMKYFKIASADLNNIPLLKKIASKKKPIFLSTGASNLEEIKSSVKLLKKYGINKIALLHCILNYPTASHNANLNMINSLKKEFVKIKIGYSDHTLPDQDMMVPTTAFLLGAKIIEKHFTLNKKLPGNDHYHSMDYKDLKKLRSNINKILNLIGNKKIKGPIPSEKKAIKNARRSIVVAKKIKKGEKFSEQNLTFKRPAVGLSISEWNKVIGKRSKKNLKEDDVVKKIHIL